MNGAPVKLYSSERALNYIYQTMHKLLTFPIYGNVIAFPRIPKILWKQLQKGDTLMLIFSRNKILCRIKITVLQNSKNAQNLLNRVSSKKKGALCSNHFMLYNKRKQSFCAVIKNSLVI